MRTVLITSALSLTLCAPALAQQEPQTRAEALQQQREEKAESTKPPDRPGLERLLLSLENDRLFERVLNPAEGFYPKLGNITPGSGTAFGPGYRRPNLFSGHGDLQLFAAGSLMKYWMLEGRLRFPRLANNKASIDLVAQRSDFPEEQFFGIGPDSRRADESFYALGNTVFGGTAGFHPVKWLSFTGAVHSLAPRVRPDAATGAGAQLFSDRVALGVSERTDFIRYELGADLNYREPRGNPRRGGRYAVFFQRFDDVDVDLYAFNRVEVDLQQYVPIVKDRRLVALRAFASMSDADNGGIVPFYLQRTLGGPDDLRGFRRFRFRDQNILLLQAEYRWEIFTAVDGAIFYDAGAVAPRASDLSLGNLESNYGIGFRFGTINGVFLRVEGAFGSSGGKHFILRWGNVF